MALARKHDLAAHAIAGGHPSPAGMIQAAERLRERLVVDPWLAALLLAAILLPLGLAAARSWLSFGSETDYLGLFVPEAKRLLAGQPLLIAFHLPLYPAAIALVWSLLGDWVRAGIAVSLLAASATALTVWWLVDRLLGRAAGLGALAALATSAPYLAQAAGAGSDLVFLALYLGASALALAGVRSGRDGAWLGLGLLIALALLTRTNALPLLLLLLAPLLRRDPAIRRARGGALALAALALPLSLWLEFAAATGSPPWPTSNHVNLAMTYFATAAHPVSNEAFVSVAGRFHDVWEVLAYDPARMLAVYLADLLTLARDRLPGLIAFPLGLLALPGLLFLPARRRSACAGLLGLVTVGELLLVNFKTFEARYWLFLLPWLGAGIGVMLAEVSARPADDRGLARRPEDRARWRGSARPRARGRSGASGAELRRGRAGRGGAGGQRARRAGRHRGRPQAASGLLHGRALRPAARSPGRGCARRLALHAAPQGSGFRLRRRDRARFQTGVAARARGPVAATLARAGRRRAGGGWTLHLRRDAACFSGAAGAAGDGTTRSGMAPARQPRAKTSRSSSAWSCRCTTRRRCSTPCSRG